jgi:hypothetical protein
LSRLECQNLTFAAFIVGEAPAWAQEFDIEYLSPVFVGDPGQLVFLNFDTGSADTYERITPLAHA